MRAMVLAAGRGERLRPLTDRLPKPLIPLGGKPLIHYTLGFLKQCGVQEVVMNLHHLGDQIQDYVGDGSGWGLRILYSWEPQLLGTGGGIQKSAMHLAHDTFVVINSDILVELDLRDVYRFHCEHRAAVTLVLRRDPEAERYGVIEVDRIHRVRRILGPPQDPPSRRTRMMFTGVHILEPAVFSHMPCERSRFSIVDVYQGMLQAGERILGYEMKGFWTDLGTPERYISAKRLVEDGDPRLDRMIHGCGKGG